MIKKIKEIAEINSGYTFRKSIKDDPKGDTFVVQAKNISYSNSLELDDLIKISSSIIKNNNFLEYNDIMIVSRGTGLGSFKSGIFLNKEEVIPSSSLHVLRIKDVTVLPKYVFVYLNSEYGQKELFQATTGGSYIRSLPIKNLLELEIPIPPIHSQKLFISLYENIQRQKDIQNRKNDINKKIMSTAFIRIIENKK